MIGVSANTSLQFSKPAIGVEALGAGIMVSEPMTVTTLHGMFAEGSPVCGIARSYHRYQLLLLVCILCNGATEESLVHLFLECPFAVQCWAWLSAQIDSSLDPFQNLQGLRSSCRFPSDLIFLQINPNFQSSKEQFRNEFQLLLLKAKRSYAPRMDQWLTNLA
jgi:hypothetical protein